MNDEAPAASQPKAAWFEPVTVILMAVSSLSTAWCSYQSSLWGGQSSELAGHADKLERKAIAQHLEATAIEAVQTRFWMEAVDATIDKDEARASFYTSRFSDELKPAYEKWIAQNPFGNPAAARDPFVAGLYVPRFEKENRDALAESALAGRKANAAGQTASSYLGNTVLLASVLFFAGTAAKFDRRRVRRSSLAFALGLFVYTAFRVAMLPAL